MAIISAWVWTIEIFPPLAVDEVIGE